MKFAEMLVNLILSRFVSGKIQEQILHTQNVILATQHMLFRTLFTWRFA